MVQTFPPTNDTMHYVGPPDTLGVECGMKTGIYGQLKAYEIILARVTHLGPKTLYDCEDRPNLGKDEAKPWLAGGGS